MGGGGSICKIRTVRRSTIKSELYQESSGRKTSDDLLV